MQYQSKLPHVGTTIFSVMSALAQEHNAINLSQGFPNFKSDSKLIYMVSKAMNSGFNQYAPMPGSFDLRTVISEKFENLYNSSYHPESEITVTAGATQAIFTVISTFISKGDEVIYFSPAYDCYEPAITLHQGIPKAIQLQSPNYAIDWNLVKSEVTSKTKMIIINTPHNPTGSILNATDLLALQDLTNGTDIIVLSDEVYEHIVFDNAQHQSACLFPELKKRTFITASFGKTFHNTGWKIGYCCGPSELMSEFRKVHQFNVFSVHHPTQVALAEYLQTPSNYTELNAFFQQKRDLFIKLIEGSKFTFTPSKGSYFQLLNYKAITDENDVEFAKQLTINNKLASIPMSVFNSNNQDDKMLRFCFAKTEDTLKQAADILQNI
ncbi:MAG: methionine aminotransferase [Bacteroidetes bacterium MedPE-SWsnd-G2]|nr:MAG: methionine aminotransferase [Bacteroidetes bacterium MedPE-SWsnd-G2]